MDSNGMKLKQTILIFTLMMGFVGLFASPIVYAAKCGDAETSIIDCPQNDNSKVNTSGIWGLLLLVINILTAGIIIAGIGGIIYGSIMYTTAGGSGDRTKKARMIITNTAIGLILYFLLYATTQYLIPGGVLK